MSDKQVKQFAKSVLDWYVGNMRRFPWRRENTTRYQHVVTEVLLQRTRAEVIAAFYPAFFRRYPSWQSLSLASLGELEDALKPIGLWKRRAQVLRALSVEMARRNGRFPVERKSIDALPGVGQYVANAVELFVHGRARPLLDVNMARVLERYFGTRKLADIRYDPYLQDLAARVAGVGESAEINWAILDFAALVCKKRGPLCEECPLRAGCKHYVVSREVGV